MPRKGYRKPAHTARTVPVNVRLTPQEKTHLLACVEASEVDGIASFLRALILDFEIKPRRPNSYAKLVYELSQLNRKLASIDNNMNQLARKANTGRIVSDIDLRRELENHRQIKHVAQDVLAKVAMR